MIQIAGCDCGKCVSLSWKEKCILAYYNPFNATEACPLLIISQTDKQIVEARQTHIWFFLSVVKQRVATSSYAR